MCPDNKYAEQYLKGFTHHTLNRFSSNNSQVKHSNSNYHPTYKKIKLQQKKSLYTQKCI